MKYLLRFLFWPLMMTFAAADVAIAAGGGEGGADGAGEGVPAGDGSVPDAPETTPEGVEPDGQGGPGEGSPGDKETPEVPAGKLDARTLPPKVKETLDALQKADPKAHGWLKDRLFAERRFREEFPGGVQEAKTLKESLTGLRELVPPTMAAASTQEVISAIQEELSEGRALDELFDKGDPASIRKMMEFAPEGFKKLLPVALSEYAKIDREGWRRDMAGVIAGELAGQNIVNRLGFALRLLAKGDAEGVTEELGAIVKGLQQYSTIAAEKPKQTDQPNPENAKREQELGQREWNLWMNETAGPINAAKTNAIKNELKQYLKDQQLDDETYQAVENQVLRYVNELLQQDPNFMPTFNAYIENRDRAGVTKFMASKMKEVLPSKVVSGQRRMGPVERAFKIFFRGSKPQAATPGGTKPAAAPAKPAPKGWERIDASKAPQPHEIDRKQTPFELSFAKAAILKNGKKVFWGDQPPASA